MQNFILQKCSHTILDSHLASPTNANVGDRVGNMSEIKLTERQQVILIIIKESPSITAKQMSEALSVSSRTIERDLSTLKEKDVLKRVRMLKELYLLHEHPQNIKFEFLTFYYLENCILFIPVGTEDAYRNDERFCWFKEVKIER